MHCSSFTVLIPFLARILFGIFSHILPGLYQIWPIFSVLFPCSSHIFSFQPTDQHSVASGATSPGAAIAAASGAAAAGGSSEAWPRTVSKPCRSARRALSLWCFRRFWHFLAAKFKMTVSRHVVTDCNLRKCSWIFWNASGFVLRHSIQISGQLPWKSHSQNHHCR